MEIEKPESYNNAAKECIAMRHKHEPVRDEKLKKEQERYEKAVSALEEKYKIREFRKEEREIENKHRAINRRIEDEYNEAMSEVRSNFKKERNKLGRL